MGKKKAFTKGNAKTVAKNIFKVAGAPQNKKKTKVVKTQIKKVPTSIGPKSSGNRFISIFSLIDYVDPGEREIATRDLRSPTEVAA